MHPRHEFQSASSTKPQHHTDSSVTEAMHRREELKRTARETLDILPAVMKQLDHSIDVFRSQKLSCQAVRRLHPNKCPAFPEAARIKVYNDDTLNVATSLAQSVHDDSNNPSQSLRPVVINFASYRNPGGGWLNGAIAQEEAICYRTSLAKSLKKRDYPLAMDEAIYSPSVLVLRSDMASGHNLLTKNIPAEYLPIVSVISIAAIYRPQVQTFEIKNNHDESDPFEQPREQHLFVRDKDRNTTKAKMRLALRIAATAGHRQLVLGALGCGVYRNPPDDIAFCWLEVLQEVEFSGHWWQEVCFAVFDSNNEGNYAIFARVLDGKEV